MSAEPPPQIKKCIQQLEELLNDEGSLKGPREQCLKAIADGEGDVKTVKGLLDQYVAFIEPIKKQAKVLKSFVEYTKETMQEGLQKAKEADKDGEFKKGKWYQGQKELLDDTMIFLNDLFTLKTEVDYYVAELQGKLSKLDGPATKAAETPPAEQVPDKATSEFNGAMVQEFDARTLSSGSDNSGFASTPTPSMQPSYAQPVQAQPLYAQPVQAQPGQAQTYQSQTMVNPYIELGRNASPSIQGSSNDPAFSEMQAATIKTLEARLEETSTREKKYKKKYRGQKELISTLQEEIRSLRAEKENKSAANKGLAKFQDKMQVNHQELLRAIAEVRLDYFKSKA